MRSIIEMRVGKVLLLLLLPLRGDGNFNLKILSYSLVKGRRSGLTRLIKRFGRRAVNFYGHTSPDSNDGCCHCVSHTISHFIMQ